MKKTVVYDVQWQGTLMSSGWISAPIYKEDVRINPFKTLNAAAKSVDEAQAIVRNSGAKKLKTRIMKITTIERRAL